MSTPSIQAPTSNLAGEISAAKLEEAVRQLNVCNACRYCEGFCSVFPAAFDKRHFETSDVLQLANLCHNCRGCYYACQYAPPHAFDLNLPAVLAQVRTESWQGFAFPHSLAKLFQRRGGAIAGLVVALFSVLFLALLFVGGLGEENGQGFYRLLSHGLMVTIFAPAFLLPLLAIGLGLWRYWRAVEGRWIKPIELARALHNAFTMKNLGGGHGEGCNFEDEDRFSNMRRWLHQAAAYGFLLCFFSTSSATLLHYLFDMPAPYPWWSLPKIFGLSGGLLLTGGSFGLAWLKTQADSRLADQAVWGGEMGFVLLLGTVGLSGLLLYWLGSTPLLMFMLAVHLSSVLALFVLMPYSKMAHGFYRMAALIRDEQRKGGRV